MNPEINLHPTFEKRKPENYIGLVVVIVVIGAAILFLAMTVMSLKQQNADLTAQEQQLIADRTLLQTQSQLAEPIMEISYPDAVLFVEMNAYPVTPFIEEIQSIRNPNEFIHTYSFAPGLFTINADFETKSDIAFFVESLMKSNYFVDVQVDTIQEFELGEVAAQEGASEVSSGAPRYTTSIRLVPLPEYTAEGVVTP